MKSKRIAFFYSRTKLNAARIEFMPFGLNFIKSLDNEGYKVDLFLAERENDSYKTIFSDNIKVIFIDNDFIWKRGKGKKFYYYAKFLLFIFLLKYKINHDLIVGMGVFGNFVAAEITKRKKIKYVYMGDEFPVLYGNFWNEVDKDNIRRADLVIVPDETRIEGTKLIVGNSLQVDFTVLPNAPLISDVCSLPTINWHKELGINEAKKIVLYGGGVEFFNQLTEIMVELPRWRDDFVLVINAPIETKKDFEYYFIEGKCVWQSKPLSDSKFHSLVKSSIANIALYRKDVSYLEFVGKSSGKIMRSIACGIPVITSKMDSLNFVSDLKLGIELTHTCDLPLALEYIEAHFSELSENCNISFSEKLCYDVYWNNFREQFLIPLLNKQT